MTDPVTAITAIATAFSTAKALKTKEPKLPEQKKVALPNPDDPGNRAAKQRDNMKRLEGQDTRLSTYLSNSSGGLG
jgi:hypothetical protein